MPKKKAYDMPPPMPVGERLSDISGNQWCLGKSIGKGGFGEIYLASKGKSTADYVIKIEPYENGPLFTELACYRRILLDDKIHRWVTQQKLDYLAVPTFISSGLHDFSKQRFRFMVMERYGNDLQGCFNAAGRFCEDTVCYLAQNLLEALHYLHSSGYVHADIKSSNLLTGARKGEEHRVYLVDYGLVHLYLSDGKHKPYRVDPKSKHNGTLEFTSIDAHNGVQPSRRGDLEILGYCLLHWSSGTLPWLKEKNEEKVASSKRKYHGNARGLVDACFKSGAPQHLVDYMSSVYKLDYTQEPPYTKLLKMFARGRDPIKSLEWMKSPVSRKRKSSEGVPGAAKKRCMEVKDAVADRPAKRKSGEAGVKKSSSSAQPARPAEIRSVKEAPAAVKKSRSVVKAAKPVKPANKIKSAEKVVGAVQKNRGGAKLVEPVRPDKVQAKLVSPKGKPNVKSARSPKIPLLVLNSSITSSSDGSPRRSARIRQKPRFSYKDLDRSDRSLNGSF